MQRLLTFLDGLQIWYMNYNLYLKGILVKVKMEILTVYSLALQKQQAKWNDRF